MIQKGQTLLELIISVTLILIVITGVTILTVKGMQNSQFSRNQVQATKLAQEGIDKVRTIRDSNYTICGWTSSANTIASNGLWTVNCPSPNGCRYTIQQTTGTCATTNDTSNLWLKYTSSTTASEDLQIGTSGVIFHRAVTVTNGNDLGGAASANIKNINVTVTWTDSSGTHSSSVSTILTNK